MSGLGACDLPWGHDGDQHANAGDGFYSVANEGLHRGRQRMRAELAGQPERRLDQAALRELAGTTGGGVQERREVSPLKPGVLQLPRQPPMLTRAEREAAFPPDEGRLAQGLPKRPAPAHLTAEQAAEAEAIGEGYPNPVCVGCGFHLPVHRSGCALKHEWNVQATGVVPVKPESVFERGERYRKLWEAAERGLTRERAATNALKVVCLVLLAVALGFGSAVFSVRW
jgi:hypothetical protein